MVFILAGLPLCGRLPDHGDDQYMQQWVAMTFKISVPLQGHYYFKQVAFKCRILGVFFFHSRLACERSTNWLGFRYGHPPNLLNCAVNWESVELILFPALLSSSCTLCSLGYFPHSSTSVFHFPSFFPHFALSIQTKLLHACTSSRLFLLLWLWPEHQCSEP